MTDEAITTQRESEEKKVAPLISKMDLLHPSKTCVQFVPLLQNIAKYRITYMK